MHKAEILVGHAVSSLKGLPDGGVRTCVTSPPYWGLRDYGNDDQIGLEASPSEFVESLCQVFDEVWRVLADDGTVWVNLGDSYAGASLSRASNNGRAGYGNPREGTFSRLGDGLKHKDLVGIPWRFAFAMQERGWYLRQDIIWAKPNPMPESVTDRCTKSHEYIFLFSKQPKYFFDGEAIKEKASTEPAARDKNAEGYQADYPGGDRFSAGARVYGADGMRNKRSVWNVGVASFKDAHFAVYPPALIEPCIKAGSAEGDTVLDPFSGSGTTGEVALKLGRNYVGCELNPDYARLSEKRISEALGMFAEVEVRDV
jgi:site-specific DNA-methyltransferase (adenine-specific)